MKNKGFTLIELLAVIVILAIIALIATPIILGIISNTRSESKVRSAEAVVDAVKTAYVAVQMKTGTNLNNETILANTKLSNVTKSGNTITTKDGVVCTLSESYVLTCTYNGENVIEPISIGFYTGTLYATNGVRVGDSIVPFTNDIYCVVSETGGFNTCIDYDVIFSSKSECETQIEDLGEEIPEDSQCILAKDSVSPTMYCEVSESEDYNSCVNDNLTFATKQECEDDIESLGEYASEDTKCVSQTTGIYCASSETAGYNSCISEGLIYKTKFECEENLDELGEDAECLQGTFKSGLQGGTSSLPTDDVYLKYDIDNNIIKNSYVCMKFGSGENRQDVCLQGGNPEYYGTYDSIMIYPVNPTGNIKIINDARALIENYVCSFSTTSSNCGSSQRSISASSDGAVSVRIGTKLGAVGGSGNYCLIDSDGNARCSSFVQ